MPRLPTVFQRHPRFSLFTVMAFFGTMLLLNLNSSDLGNISVTFDHSRGNVKSLASRLNSAEQIYEKTLKGRSWLIQKFGGVDKIHMFPPNVPPYPAYTVWDFFPASYNCPHEVERIGAFGDGGKWVCGLSRIENKPDCVIYSFGINHESSFEAELLTRTSGCQVWGYDFSVDGWGPEITPELSPRAHFHAYGLGGEDKHEEHDNPKFYTLATLMEMNGHTHIDILKIDIESWEFPTLSTLLASYKAAGRPLPFSQLQIEIHAWDMTFSTFLSWWQSLEEMGLRPFWTEPNEVYSNYNRGSPPALAEYSFFNVLGKHALVTDH